MNILSNTLSAKIPYIVTDDYVIYLEPFLHLVWVHVDVHRWTPAVRRAYQKDFDSVPGPLYALNDEPLQNWKLTKFMLKTGWTYHSSTDYGDIYRRG